MKPLAQFTPPGTATVEVPWLTGAADSRAVRRISINNSSGTAVTIAVYLPVRSEAAAQKNAIIGPFSLGRGTITDDYESPLVIEQGQRIYFAGNTACTLTILGD